MSTHPAPPRTTETSGAEAPRTGVRGSRHDRAPAARHRLLPGPYGELRTL